MAHGKQSQLTAGTQQSTLHTLASVRKPLRARGRVSRPQYSGALTQLASGVERQYAYDRQESQYVGMAEQSPCTRAE